MREVRCPECKKPQITKVEKIVSYVIHAVEEIDDDGDFRYRGSDDGDGEIDSSYIECHNCYTIWRDESEFIKRLLPDQSLKAINVAQGQLDINGRKIT